jgi:hypothetical protein
MAKYEFLNFWVNISVNIKRQVLKSAWLPGPFFKRETGLLSGPVIGQPVLFRNYCIDSRDRKQYAIKE